MTFRINHIGWITNDIQKFESFWCDILEFECTHTSKAPAEMMESLFGDVGPAEIKRYSHSSSDIDIEIHYFKNGSLNLPQNFNRFGINHICLHTGEKGSRDSFLKRLPPSIKVHIYDNPGGWQNIFIRDYEENWVELRENWV